MKIWCDEGLLLELSNVFRNQNPLPHSHFGTMQDAVLKNLLHLIIFHWK